MGYDSEFAGAGVFSVEERGTLRPPSRTPKLSGQEYTAEA